MSDAAADDTVDEPSRRRSWLRLAAIAGGVALTVVVLVVAVLHTPPARRGLAGWLQGRLAAAGIDSEIGELRYSLLDLDFQVEELRLRARAAEEPFLVADTLRVDLPWSIVAGELAIESVELGSATVRLTRDPGGAWNLPVGAGSDDAGAPPDAGGGPVTLPRIGRLQVDDARVELADGESGLGLALPGLQVAGDDLADGARLTLTSPGTLRLEGRATEVQELEGGLAWDGSSLTLDGLTVALAAATLTVDGTLDDLAGEPAWSLDVDAVARVQEVGAFLGVDDVPAGEMRLAGRVTGALAAPSATLQVDSGSLAWRQLEATGLTAALTASPDAVVLDSLETAVAGGRATGSGELRYGEEALPGSVHVELDSISPTALSVALADGPRLDGRLDAVVDASWSRWPEDAPDAVTAQARLTARPAPETGPGLAVRGSLELDLENGAWELRGDPRLADALAVDADLAGRLAAPLADSTLGGTLRITSDDLSRLPAALAELTKEVPELAGTGRADLRLGGSLGNAGFQGPVEVNGPRVAGVVADRLTGRLAGDGSEIRIEDLVVEAGGDRATGSARVDLASGGLSGRLEAGFADLPGLLPGAPEGTVPAGPVRIEGELGGSLEAPRLGLTARGDGLRVAGQRGLDVEARAELRDTTLRVEELVARQVERDGLASGEGRDPAAGAGDEPDPQGGAGRLAAAAADLEGCRAADPAPGCLRLTGSWEMSSGSLTLQGQARGIEVDPVEVAGTEVPVTGTFDLAVDGRRDTTGLSGEASVDVAGLAAYGLEPGPVRLEATGDGDALELRGTASELATTVEGRVTTAGAFEFRGDLDGLPLQRLVAPSGRDLQARLTATLYLAGDLGGGTPDDLPGEPPEGASLSRAALEIRGLDGALDGVPLRLVEAGTVELAGDALHTDGLELGLGAATLRLEGSYPGDGEALVATLTGDLADFGSLAVLAAGPGRQPLDLVMSGALEARLELAGVVDSPRATGSLTLRDGELGTGELPPLREVDLEVLLEEGVVVLESLSATWQEARLDAAGRLPLGVVADAVPFPAALEGLPRADGVASLEVRVGPLTAEALRPFLEPEAVENVQGQLVANLAVTAAEPRLEAVEGHLVLEQADITIAGARLQQREQTRLEFVAGRLEVRELRWGGTGTELRVTGSLPLDAEGTLDLQARGNIDLRVLQLLVPGAAAGGTGDLGVDLAGTITEPDLAGGIDIRNAELRLPAAQLAFLDVTGRIALDGSTIIVEPVAGELNGGAFVLTGEIPAADPTGGRLDLTAVDVAVQPAEGFRSLVDLGLGLDLSAGLPGRLHGTVTITRGSYRERMSVVGQLLDQTRSVAAVAPGASASTLDDLRLDLRIVTENDILVDNNLAELALTANLELTGTLGAPGLTGRAEIMPGGTVFLSGNRFRVEGGTIDFTSVRSIEPQFDLTALTRVNDYQITLRITGTPDEPDLDLTSDPSLPESDVASLLVTGRTLERAEASQTAVAQEQLLGLLASELTGRLGETVGLDSVRLERGPVQESFRSYPSLIASETDPTQRLTVSKNIRPDLELVLSQALNRSGGLTWLANYEIIRDLELQALFDDDNNRAYQFGQQLSFGGGETVTPSSAAPEERVEVTAVVLEGDSPLADPELRDVLELEAGDRFDFFRWQEDRERLASLHQDQGWLEARVDADRSDPEESAGSTRLVYTITTGPRTSIEVSGTDLTDDVRDELRATWAHSVLDDFLLEEATEIVRLHLADRGFVAPTVEASVDTATEGEKRLVLTVDPGPASDERRVEVTGNRRLDAERIRAVLEGLDPPETAWVEPGPAVDALRAAYAAEGMPEAEIDVGEPRREGGMAVLPVEVEEGPFYRVAQVQLVGVEAIPTAEAQATLRLATGDPWVASRVDGARRALEALYRNRGYTAAEVEVDAPRSDAIAEDEAGGAVDVPVTFRVAEGPLETVAAIEVRGATITHEGIIDRALDLTEGDPVDRNVLARARKRLYDTGAFRRVDIEVEPTGPAENGEVPARIIVSVGERPPYRFRYGLRLNSTEPLEETASRQREFGVSADLTSDNLLGRTISAGVSGRYQSDFHIGRLFVTTPRLFGLPLISSAFVARSTENVTVEFFGSERTDIVDVTGFTLEQRFSPFEDAQVAYSYSFERVHTAEEGADPDDPFSFPIIIDVSRLALSGLIDRRDDPFDATEGWFHSSQLEYSATALGSDIPFGKYLLQQYYYRPVGPVTLASAVRFGVAAAFDDQELISSERFFAGGGNSVRGYAEDSLGPTDFFGPTGGNALLELKQEIRFPIVWWFRGVGFVDAGNAFATLGDVSPGGLKVGAGFGLRIDTPFALLRLDYGLALDREPGDSRGRFFFSLGQAF